MIRRSACLVTTVALLMTAAANATAPAQQADQLQPARCVVTSGPVTLTVTVNKKMARVADAIELVIQIDAPQGTRVKMPALDDSLGAFEVLTTSDAAEIPMGDELSQRRWWRHITLETIKTGELSIPAFEVLCALPPRAAHETLRFQSIRSQPLVVRIASVLEDRADPRVFRDIKDVVDVDVPSPPSRAWMGWAAGAAGSLAAIAVAVAWTMRRKRLSPAEWALAEIARLETSALLSTDDAAAVFGELADVAREFMELQLRIAAQARTTHEFLRKLVTTAPNDAVRDSALNETLQQFLTAFLSVADEVKFARLPMGTDQLRDAVHQVRNFIAECDADSSPSQQEMS